MESIQLNNERLLQLIRSDIKDSDAIALHNICIDAYTSKINDFSEEIKIRYKINKLNITSIDIANTILQKGLYVPYNTLRCTTTFIGNKKDTFNYLYRKEDIVNNKIYTIVATIPSFITVEDKEYFVGKITQKSSGLIEPTISTDILFKNHLPKEFIYGYYIKNVFDNTISNDLAFVINPNHISRMNRLEKNNLYKGILSKENISMDLLEAVEREDRKYRSNNIHNDLCVRNAIREKQKLKR